MQPELFERQSGGGIVEALSPGTWRLSIPAGEAGSYRWAQLDDYLRLPRGRFPWNPPLRLKLSARVSASGLPGTWGFGLWNDPFSASFGLSGMAARLPALPNAAWFFSAGPPNWLALRDDHPAQGFLAATFQSPRLPSLLLAPGGLFLPLLAVRALARVARRAAAGLVKESAAHLTTDPTEWHSYAIEWTRERARFLVDGVEAHHTAVSPAGPLALVLWIDNQWAAFPPNGALGMGTSPNPAAWLELRDVRVER